jgi:hypothetical protein
MIPAELVRQVARGLARVNSELGSDHSLSKVFYIPQERPDHDVYEHLTIEFFRYLRAS